MKKKQEEPQKLINKDLMNKIVRESLEVFAKYQLTPQETLLVLTNMQSSFTKLTNVIQDTIVQDTMQDVTQMITKMRGKEEKNHYVG